MTMSYTGIVEEATQKEKFTNLKIGGKYFNISADRSAPPLGANISFTYTESTYKGRDGNPRVSKWIANWSNAVEGTSTQGNGVMTFPVPQPQERTLPNTMEQAVKDWTSNFIRAGQWDMTYQTLQGVVSMFRLVWKEEVDGEKKPAPTLDQEEDINQDIRGDEIPFN